MACLNVESHRKGMLVTLLNLSRAKGRLDTVNVLPPRIQMSKLLIIIILMLLVLAPVSQSTGVLVANSQVNIDHFTISLVWPDGVLVPFAEYQEGKWLNPWPKPEVSLEEEPNTVAD